jgi:hypothetical protein
MTTRFSTGLRNALLDQKAEARNLKVATTISFGDGTGTDGRDEILDSGNGLGNFSVGDMITVAGSTSNNVTAEILAVSAGAIEVAAGTLATEAAGDTVILAAARGGSFSEIFKYGIIKIFTGSQPASPDDAETGTLLVTITQNSGSFTPGTETNGLLFGNVAAGILSQESGQIWSGVAVATGTAGWFRIYDNAAVTGVSTTAKRCDGAVATSGAQLNMSNTAITSGGTTTIDAALVTLPAAA